MPESLNSKKDTLSVLYNSGKTKWNLETIHKLMGETFFLQRIDINRGSLVSDLVKGMPIPIPFLRDESSYNRFDVIRFGRADPESRGEDNGSLGVKNC